MNTYPAGFSALSARGYSADSESDGDGYHARRVYGSGFGTGPDVTDKALRWVSGFVIELFRGTSALVQLFWAFYVLPFFGLELSPLVAGVLVLGLNEGSYFAEVVRPALQSVVGGQRDAAITLHLPRWYRFRRIILPQALPVMIPPFGNALIGMLKFTALVSLVTLQDIAFRASMIRSSLGNSGPSLHRDIADLFRPGGDARGIGEGAGALRQPPSRARGCSIEANDAQELFARCRRGPFSVDEDCRMSRFPWEWQYVWAALPHLIAGLKLTVRRRSPDRP